MHKRSMSVVSPRYRLRRIASRSIVATSLLAIGSAWAGGPPGNEISLVNISQLTVNSASAFHRVAVSRRDPNLMAVAWREYGLPINTNAGAGPGERTADCHVSVSTDGGNTFHDTNLMSILRQNTGDPELPTEPAPGLWYCNAPWVTIGDDRTIYAGGSVFTPLGDRNWYPARGTDAPKQGRALVTVSTDNGQSWSPPTFGIRISHFAPGVTGLGCSNNLPCISSPPGTDQWHTPWDGAIAVAAPRSTTFYSKAGGHVVASEDRAQTFGLVHTINVPGWTFSSGKIEVGYTSDGKILAVWRAYYQPDNPNAAGGPGWFDTVAALLHGDDFGPTIRVSPQSSRYPTRTTMGAMVPNAADYNLNNGGGDFSTFITGDHQFAFVGFPYAPGDPDTSALDTYFAKIPLTMMQGPREK